MGFPGMVAFELGSAFFYKRIQIFNAAACQGVHIDHQTAAVLQHKNKKILRKDSVAQLIVCKSQMVFTGVVDNMDAVVRKEAILHNLGITKAGSMSDI